MTNHLDLKEMQDTFSRELREFIEEYIKDNLSIEIDKGCDFGSSGINVRLLLNNKEISSSYVATEYDRDY